MQSIRKHSIFDTTCLLHQICYIYKTLNSWMSIILHTSYFTTIDQFYYRQSDFSSHFEIDKNCTKDAFLNRLDIQGVPKEGGFTMLRFFSAMKV